MGKWIDLTLQIDESLNTYPGDKPFNIYDEKTIQKDGYNLKRMDTNMHIGTHIDVLKHVRNVTDGIEKIDINKVIGRALVINVKIINNIINTSEIIDKYDNKAKILILNLNWNKYLNTDEYYNCPKFNKDILKFFIKNKIEVLGFDIPSFSYKDELYMEMHDDLLSNNILVIENLTNLNSLNKYVDLIALPLKIKGMDGSLIRCVAKNI